MEIGIEYNKLRDKVLGLENPAGGAGGQASKGAMMAIALGMQIGEQGVKKTEEILATLKEANNLMDDMQNDILDQRKKLSRISDKVKQAQSTANRGREALKYFAQQATKDVCIIVLIALIGVAVLALLVLTWQISNEQAEIEMSPDEIAENNMKELNVEIDEKGKVVAEKDPEDELEEDLKEQQECKIYIFIERIKCEFD